MLDGGFTTSLFKLILGIVLLSSFALLVEVVPTIVREQQLKVESTLQPLSALQLQGKDVYIREGCTTCHTQMIRPLAAEVARYGPPSEAKDDVYEHPHVWGSKRGGPDLYRVGRKYSDHWQAIHLRNPRSVVPESNMPAYPWLFEQAVDYRMVQRKMRALTKLGVPYTDDDIDRARIQLLDKSQADALISYLQQLGVNQYRQEAN
jgi:cytochrome c oxidase cbb3-type subunit 2